MPTRLIYRNSSSIRSTLRDQLRQAILAGASAGLVFGLTGDAFAEGEIQLLAPMNSPQSARTADTASNKPSDSKAVVVSPRDQGVDRKDPSAPRVTGAWQGRTEGPRATDAADSPPHQVAKAESDGLREPVIEGVWVARDSINQAQLPFTSESTAASTAASTADVASVAKTREPSSGTKTIEIVSPTASKTPKVALRQPTKQQASQGNRTQDQNASATEVSAQRVKPEAYVKKAAPNTNSMSLGEAKSAIDSVVDSNPEKTANLAASDSKETSKPGESENFERVLKTLPKRKPLSNIANGGLSSSRLDATRSPQQTPKESSEASGSVGDSVSVGDIAPDDNRHLDYTGRPASVIRPTRAVSNLRRGIERTLKYFYDRPEIASGRSNWGMMHALMVFEADTKVVVGNKEYSAIAWIAGNNNCRGQRLLTHDAEGIQAKSGVGLQGHQGQFLAVMGMCNVPADYPLHAGKMKYDVAALIEAEQRACKEGEELSFTLIGLSHYLDTDSTWMADDGTQWDFERLIAEELKQPVIGAACGGTHRLMCFTHALRKRRAEGKPLTGHWKRAEIFTNDFINYAYSLQNRDGSMSTKWFEGRADNGEVDRKIQTTGHIVEWLLTVTPDDQLQDRRLVAAVSFLLRSIGSDLDHDWSIGPKGHALRSLAMYHQRVFRAGTPWIPSAVTRQATQTRRTNR